MTLTIFKDYVLSKFSNRLESFNAGFEKEGGLYLFSLRLVPIFPFFMINMLMGLTPIKTKTFYLVSQFGMLPASVVYVNAGVQFGRFESLSGILTPKIILSFVLLGIFPFLSKSSYLL